MPKLSDRLIYIRQINNMSQSDLAKVAGTTQQAIQQAEKGKARQPRYLHNIAMALDLPIEWILFGTEEVAHQKVNAPDGFQEKSSEVLDHFYSMPEEDQDLILKLMQSRKK